VRLWCAA